MAGTNGLGTPQPINIAETIQVSMPAAAIQLPTPAMDGEPPTVLSAIAGMNGARVPEVSFHQNVGRNIYAESDNPIERKYRDPGKGESDRIASVAELNACRSSRRSSRLGDLHDASQLAQRPQVETDSLRVADQNPDVILHLSTVRPLLSARHPYPDAGAPLQTQPEVVCIVELATGCSESAGSGRLRFPPSSWRKRDCGRRDRRVEGG